MKTKLIAFILGAAFTASAQLTYVDITTLTTNRVTNSASITITNVCTNSVYVTINTNNILRGDPLYTAFTKVNADILWLSTGVRTNGATGSGQIPYSTNTAPGYFWAAPTGGSGGGGTSNAIPNLNGLGTNINLYGTSTLNGGGLQFYETIVGITNYPLIPTMSGSNTPSGTASASCIFTAGSEPFRAFTNGLAPTWASCPSSNAWVQYQFAQPVIVTNFTGYLSGITATGTVTLASSPDGSNWTTMATFTGINPTNAATSYKTNAVYATAPIFRWTFNDPGHSDVFIAGNLQLYGYQQANEVIVSSKTLQIISTNYGVGINTNNAGTNALRVVGNVDSTVGFTVNGIPIVSGGGGSGLPWLASTNLWVTGGTGLASNYNGTLQDSGLGYYTNIVTGWILTKMNTVISGVSNSVSTITGGYLMITNLQQLAVGAANFEAPPSFSSFFLTGNYSSIALDPTSTNSQINVSYTTAGFSNLVAGIASGTSGTNTITAYNLSNAILSSAKIITIATNYCYWTGSNYLGRVAGLYSWTLAGGDDGGNPPMQIPVSLVGSYSGSNSWFTITNGFRTTNTISIAVRTNGLTAQGGHLINPGFCQLFTMDHPELLNRTNNLFGQFTRFDAPINPSDAATKGYADTLFANAFNNNFSSVMDTNGLNHFSYSYENFTVMDLASQLVWIPVVTAAAGTNGNYNYDNYPPTFCPTNFVLTVAQSNLLSGFNVQSSTNLSLAAGFTTITNYTMSTNSGMVSITVPVNFSWSAQFFRVISGSSYHATFYTPLAMPYAAFTTATVTHSTNSTFGYGAGLMTCDTNYVYVSITTNTWRRISIPTNTW